MCFVGNGIQVQDDSGGAAPKGAFYRATLQPAAAGVEDEELPSRGQTRAEGVYDNPQTFEAYVSAAHAAHLLHDDEREDV